MQNFSITWLFPLSPWSNSLKITWDAAFQAWSPKNSCQMKHSSQLLGCEYFLSQQTRYNPIFFRTSNKTTTRCDCSYIVRWLKGHANLATAGRASPLSCSRLWAHGILWVLARLSYPVTAPNSPAPYLTDTIGLIYLFNACLCKDIKQLRINWKKLIFPGAKEKQMRAFSSPLSFS